MALTVVLVGAGASYGCGDVHPNNPPLGKDLFAALEAAGGIAAALPSELKDKFRASFEDGMAAYRLHTRDNLMAFQRELARYFAQFRPGLSNAYCDMISSLRDFDVVYGSLNYDMLFELAASRLGQNVVYEATPRAGFVRHLKPHGSCHFWPDIPPGTFNGVTLSGNGSADIVGPVKPLSPRDTLLRCDEEEFAPAIALYAEGKPVRMCPRFVERQASELTQAILSSAGVFVVGVRVWPADEHLWGPLARTPASIHYFGLNGPLASAGRRTPLSRRGFPTLFARWRSYMSRCPLPNSAVSADVALAALGTTQLNARSLRL
jgi:hypothetical protein